MMQALFRKMLPAATNVEPRGAVPCPSILTNTFPATFEQYVCRWSLQSRFFLRFHHPTAGLSSQMDNVDLEVLKKASADGGYGVRVHRLNVCILMLVSILSFSGCGKSPDQKAYEEVVATMSMEKAKGFFDSYPQSRYREQLIHQITEWCGREDTKECYQLIIQTLPQDDRLYPEVVAFYEKRFEARKPK